MTSKVEKTGTHMCPLGFTGGPPLFGCESLLPIRLVVLISAPHRFRSSSLALMGVLFAFLCTIFFYRLRNRLATERVRRRRHRVHTHSSHIAIYWSVGGSANRGRQFQVSFPFLCCTLESGAHRSFVTCKKVHRPGTMTAWMTWPTRLEHFGGFAFRTKFEPPNFLLRRFFVC